MDFGFTPEQLMLRDAATDIVGSEISSERIREALGVDGVKVRLELWELMVSLGWSTVLVPEAQGGSGGGALEACILSEVLAGALAPCPFVSAAIGAASLLIALEDTVSLERLAAGQPMAAVFDDRLEWRSGKQTIAWDWLPGALLVGPGGALSQEHAIQTPVKFDDTDPLHPAAVVSGLPIARVVRSDRLRKAEATLRVGVAAAAVGLARAALNEAVEYATQRVQYGKTIGEFQAIQHICAEMLVNVETSTSMTYGAAWIVDNESIDQAEQAAAAAVGWCVPAAIKTLEDGIQVLGGIGVTWEHDAHLRLRNAHQIARVLGGAQASFQLLAIGALDRTSEDANGSA
jgi:alkylation response protein AidB-like acyl-CoA dehydrogenase